VKLLCPNRAQLSSCHVPHRAFLVPTARPVPRCVLSLRGRVCWYQVTLQCRNHASASTYAAAGRPCSAGFCPVTSASRHEPSAIVPVQCNAPGRFEPSSQSDARSEAHRTPTQIPNHQPLRRAQRSTGRLARYAGRLQLVSWVDGAIQRLIRRNLRSESSSHEPWQASTSLAEGTRLALPSCLRYDAIRIYSQTAGGNEPASTLGSRRDRPRELAEARRLCKRASAQMLPDYMVPLRHRW